MNITALIGLHLESYLTLSKLDPELFAHLRRQIDEQQDLQDRRNFDGHATSSFALLNPDLTALLMIHHKGFDKWLFPGGHYEGPVSLRVSALRELTEETGFPAEQVAFLHSGDFLALDLDTHAIDARPSKNEDAHWHHDFLYLGVAKKLVALDPQMEEVYAAKWILLEDALQLPDERVTRAVKKIIKRLP